MLMWKLNYSHRQTEQTKPSMNSVNESELRIRRIASTSSLQFLNP